jgi:hypothetical protein
MGKPPGLPLPEGHPSSTEKSAEPEPKVGKSAEVSQVFLGSCLMAFDGYLPVITHENYQSHTWRFQWEHDFCKGGFSLAGCDYPRVESKPETDGYALVHGHLCMLRKICNYLCDAVDGNV